MANTETDYTILNGNEDTTIRNETKTHVDENENKEIVKELTEELTKEVEMQTDLDEQEPEQQVNERQESDENEEDGDDDDEEETEQNNCHEDPDDQPLFKTIPNTELFLVTLNKNPIFYASTRVEASELAENIANRMRWEYNTGSVWRRYFIDHDNLKNCFTVYYNLPFLFSFYDSVSDTIEVLSISKSELNI